LKSNINKTIAMMGKAN